MTFDGRMHLPGKSIEAAAAEFEDSERRREAKTYEEYIDIWLSAMPWHMSRNTNPVRHAREQWWDNEVTQTWKARREANRAHHRAVKAKYPEVCNEEMQHYVKLKLEMQALSK
ncbi:hypothetical protein MRX96_034852 [Rhipicephalus microplus]